ncbi:hypothetical protein V8E55_012154 [Tylopilus felleus]
MHLPGDVATVATVYGSMLLGTCIGSALTGIVFVQCVLYYKLYPGDFAWTKALVFAVWAFDMIHTVCIITATWQSVIVNFDKPQNMDDIPSALGLSVAVTALVTFMVHCFFANRIRMLTKKWYIAAPVVFLAFLRLFSACVSTSEIIRLKHYSLFIKPYPSWVFTVGVTLSASVEFIITTIMIIFLGSRKTGFANMTHVINSLILYTLETGSVTCIVAMRMSPRARGIPLLTFSQWLLMRHNLIFLGMHFAIAKLYANSLLATLNTRKRFRVDRLNTSERDQNGLGPLPSPINKSHFSVNRMLNPAATHKSINVNVETTVVSHLDLDRDNCDIETAPTDTQTLREYSHDGQYKGTDRGSSDREDEKYPDYV